MPWAGRFLSWRSTLYWDFSSKSPNKVSISKQKMLLQRAKIIYIAYFHELLNSPKMSFGLSLKSFCWRSASFFNLSNAKTQTKLLYFFTNNRLVLGKSVLFEESFGLLIFLQKINKTEALFSKSHLAKSNDIYRKQAFPPFPSTYFCR